MSDEGDENNLPVFDDSESTYCQMSDDIEDIIREMDEIEIARIRGGYNDPLYYKGDEIRYRDQTWKIVDFDLWNDGKPRYLLRPIGEDWIESHPQDLVDMVAREMREDE